MTSGATMRSATRRKGFTLVEVVVAVAIAAGMFAVAYRLLLGTVHASRLAGEGQDLDRIGQGVMDLMARDLTMLPEAQMRQGDPPSFEGAADGNRNSTLNFLSAADSLGVGDHPAPSDVTEVGYKAEARQDMGNAYKLYRREQFFVDADRLKGGTWSLLAPHVRSFGIEYRTEGDPPAWAKSWSQGPNQTIPKMVRITLVLFQPLPPDSPAEQKPDEKTYTMVVLCRR